MLSSLLALGVAYLIGSFPSAYLAAKLKGEDIFSVGSGNMGAMNTARNLGYGLGALVLILDVGKGALAAWLGLRFSSPDFLLAFVATVGVVAGHAWSIFMKFKGGKALATAWGTTLPLYPLGGAAAISLLVLLSLTMKGRSNLAAVITCGVFPVLVFASSYWHFSEFGQSLIAFLCSMGVATIMIAKHWPALGDERRKIQEKRRTV